MAAATKDVLIYLFGDSLAYGTYDTEKGGWFNRLSNTYKDTYNKIVAYNLSIPGETTAGVIARFDAEVHARYNRDKNNIILFALGLNDSADFGTLKQVPLSLFAMNIKKLIAMARKYTNNICFIGLLPVNEASAATIKRNERLFYYNTTIQAYDDAIKDICDKSDCQYISMRGVLSPHDFADGVHPNPVGYQKMCDKILSSRKYH